MYKTKDNFNGCPMAVFFLMMLAQSYSHSCLNCTQDGWIPHMDFPIPPLDMTLSSKERKQIIYRFISSEYCKVNVVFVFLNLCLFVLSLRHSSFVLFLNVSQTHLQ